MNIDVGELSMIQLLAYRSYFESLSDKVHLYVRATPAVLKYNPVMEGHVQGRIEEQPNTGHVIFNISSCAIRNLHRDDQNLIFGARFQGAEYTIRVPLGDIAGICTDKPDDLIIDPMVIVTSTLEGGGILLRPIRSTDAEAPTPVVEKSRERPVLTVVK